ncbi:MAG: hypothetical protein JW874_16260, partial [Spirochaetales bacterium]|nr:hypothetical protein [Spirochaetales bacterium]
FFCGKKIVNLPEDLFYYFLNVRKIFDVIGAFISLYGPVVFSSCVRNMDIIKHAQWPEFTRCSGKIRSNSGIKAPVDNQSTG